MTLPLTLNQIKKLSQELRPHGFIFPDDIDHDIGTKARTKCTNHLYRWLQEIKHYEGPNDKTYMMHYIHHSDWFNETRDAIAADIQQMKIALKTVPVEEPTQRTQEELEERKAVYEINREVNNWFANVETEEPRVRERHPFGTGEQLNQEVNDWFANIETQPTTQRPHEERDAIHEIHQIQYDPVRVQESRKERYEHWQQMQQLLAYDDNAYPMITLPLGREFRKAELERAQELIKNALREFFDSTSATDRILIEQTKSNGTITYVPLTPDGIKKIMDDLEAGALFNAFYIPAEHMTIFSDVADNPIDDWYYK